MEARHDTANDEFQKENSRQELSRQSVCCTIAQNPAVLLFALPFALIQGAAGGVVLGNASLMARALGSSENGAQAVVSFFSVANCGGRIAIGIIMDRCQIISKPKLM